MRARWRAVVEEILTAGGTALAIRANMADLLDVERLFTETIAAFGGVNVVVQTSQRDGSVVDQRAARWLRYGGAIVHVAGSHVISPVLANELRARSITVIQVALGPGIRHCVGLSPGPRRSRSLGVDRRLRRPCRSRHAVGPMAT